MNFLSDELDRMLEEYEALDMEWRMLAEQPFTLDNLNDITSMLTIKPDFSILLLFYRMICWCKYD